LSSDEKRHDRTNTLRKKEMKPIKTFVLGVGILSMGMGVAGLENQVHAGSSASSEYVKDVDLAFPGTAAVITVRNTAVNKHVSAVSLKVQESKLDFLLNGSVTCKEGNNIFFGRADAYFGSVAMGGLNNIYTNATLHVEQVDVAYTDKAHKIAESTEDTLSVPVNKLKNGHPLLRVDALQELAKKLQIHVQGGGKAVDFYRQDHSIVLQRPISLVAICGKPGDSTYGYETRNHTIQIKYVGDPAVNDTPVLSATVAKNMPNQINSDLPIQMDKADFQPNMPHYIGKCLPDDNQKIQINLQFSGKGAGYMDLRVIAVSNSYADYGTYYAFANLSVNAKYSKKIDFSFPLKTMLEQDKYAYMAISNSKTWNHNMKIQARVKPGADDQWGPWKDYDTAVFKHRCLPQVNPVLNSNGKIGGFQDGDGNNGAKAKRAVTPQATPVSPKIKARDEKGLILPAIQKAK
jgi:hypothetical protein